MRTLPAVVSIQGVEETQTVESEIRYANSSGAAIAYQVVGDGPIDLVFVPDFMSNLVYGWETPRWRSFYESLSAFSRLILFDKRGTGLSDHTGGFPTLETRMEDLRAVLDAAGSERAAILGSHEGCGMAALFSATYPERTRALVLFQAVATGTSSADFPWAPTADEWRRDLAVIRENWGTQEFTERLLGLIAPTLAASSDDRRWVANWLRVGASPGAAHALNRIYMETDLRHVLPAIRVPTLLLYRGTDFEEPARNVAERIPDARVVGLPGNDSWGIFLSEEIPVEIERFIAGSEAAPQTHRVLTTVLFTDLVESSARAVELGDRAWSELLARHHGIVRQQLARFGGREVDIAGDGFLATFEGPARAIRCAAAIRDALSGVELDIRLGIHSGECELVGDKPTGIAVHTGARISAVAAAGEILVSSTVKDLVAGSGIRFADRGSHALKGVPDEWRLYTVVDV